MSRRQAQALFTASALSSPEKKTVMHGWRAFSPCSIRALVMIPISIVGSHKGSPSAVVASAEIVEVFVAVVVTVGEVVVVVVTEELRVVVVFSMLDSVVVMEVVSMSTVAVVVVVSAVVVVVAADAVVVVFFVVVVVVRVAVVEDVLVFLVLLESVVLGTGSGLTVEEIVLLTFLVESALVGTAGVVTVELLVVFLKGRVAVVQERRVLLIQSEDPQSDVASGVSVQMITRRSKNHRVLYIMAMAVLLVRPYRWDDS